MDQLSHIQHRGVFGRFLRGQFMLGSTTGLACNMALIPFLTQTATAVPLNDWYGITK